MKLRWRTRGQTSPDFGEWRSIAEPDGPTVVLLGPVGPLGIGAPARDMLRLGLAVHTIERSLPAGVSTNRPVEFEVEIELEQPRRWTRSAIDALELLLGFQGDAVWRWKLLHGARPLQSLRDAGAIKDDGPVDRIALFSGGLDGTCGIASDRKAAARTRLVSHYSHQKCRQVALAKGLGYGPPTQCRIGGLSGRGRGFFYRSFYFLCLAAAVASSYAVKRIVQYENGILATAVPPAPAYFMTRHAHPKTQRLAEALFSTVLGGNWTIENPFSGKTKGEAVHDLVTQFGAAKSKQIIEQTETCWFQYSNQLSAGRSKDNGKPCGVCVPCIVRRAAVQRQEGHYDLNDANVRADPVLSRDFNAYRDFVKRALGEGGGERMFLEFPSYVRELTRGVDPEFSRAGLIGLFQRFACEFNDAFGKP